MQASLTVHPLLIAGGFTMDYRFTANFPHCYVIYHSRHRRYRYQIRLLLRCWRLPLDSRHHKLHHPLLFHPRHGMHLRCRDESVHSGGEYGDGRKSLNQFRGELYMASCESEFAGRDGAVRVWLEWSSRCFRRWSYEVEGLWVLRISTNWLNYLISATPHENVLLLGAYHLLSQFLEG